MLCKLFTIIINTEVEIGKLVMKCAVFFVYVCVYLFQNVLLGAPIKDRAGATGRRRADVGFGFIKVRA